MSELQGKGGELRATIQIKRAATGQVETFELVGCADPDKLADLVARVNREHGTAGAMVGQGSAVNKPEES